MCPCAHAIRSDIIFSLIPPVSNSTHNGSDWYITYHILSQQSAQLNLHVGVCFLSHLFQSCLTMECSICSLASSPVCGRGLPLVSGSSRKVKEAASMVTPNTSGGSPATPDYSTVQSVQYSAVQCQAVASRRVTTSYHHLTCVHSAAQLHHKGGYCTTALSTGGSL